MTRYKLTKSHTHAGRRYPAGAEITVDAATAAWLDRHQCGHTCMDVPQLESDHFPVTPRGRRRRESTEETHHGD